MACNTTFLHAQNDKILKTTILLRNLSVLVFTDGQTFFLFSNIIFSPNRLLDINLLALPDRLIKQ